MRRWEYFRKVLRKWAREAKAKTGLSTPQFELDEYDLTSFDDEIYGVQYSGKVEDLDRATKADIEHAVTQLTDFSNAAARRDAKIGGVEVNVVFLAAT